MARSAGAFECGEFQFIMHPLHEADTTESQRTFVATACGLVESRGMTTLPKRVSFFMANYDPLDRSVARKRRRPFLTE